MSERLTLDETAGQTSRLGSVPYLNAQPLLHGLEAALATPAVLAGWLRAGKVDAALVPVVEAIEHPVYWIVDGLCIGCDGPVYSVFLVLDQPLEQVRRIALDHASRTSVELTRRLMGSAIDYVPEGEPADARLLIGDRAIAYRHAHPEARLLDLGEAWKAATGGPFVFAVWALRRPDTALADRLRAAAAAGLAARPALAREPWMLRYLTEHIRYRLGERERAGLARFAEGRGGPWSPRWI